MQVTMGTEHAQTVCTRLSFLCARTYESLGTRLGNILFLIYRCTDLLITVQLLKTQYVCIHVYPFTLITVIEAFGKHRRNLAVSFIRDTHWADYFTPWTSNSYCILYIPNPWVLGTRPVLPCKNGYCCKLELVRANSMLVSQYIAIYLPLVAHRWNCYTLSLIAVAPTILEKSVFYKYLSVPSASLGLPIQLGLGLLSNY